MRILFLLALIGYVIAIDVIIESLKQLVDENTNPCDNFYRHVCPLGSPSKTLLNMINSDLVKNSEYKIWNSFELTNDLGLVRNRNTKTRASRSATPFDYATEFPTLYRNLCKKGINTERFLIRLAEMLKQPGQKLDCASEDCVLHLRDDPNCERVEKQLNLVLSKVDKRLFDAYRIEVRSIQSNFWNIQNISLHLNNNLEDGIEETNRLVEEMKSIAFEMISETPWAQNNNVTKLTTGVLEETHLKSDYAKIMRDALDSLIRSELDYRQCKQEIGNDELTAIFCMFYVLKTISDRESFAELNYFPFFENKPNAGNIFPFLSFGMPMYYLAKHTEEKAAKLGSLGFVVGHEVSHTIIKGDKDFVLTYFSEEAKDCVQNQYNKTCTEFKEKGCETYDKEIDENGSDILSVQIAYKMLEEEYGDRLSDIYEPLNVTYQQLFFYSAVVFFCDGLEQDVFRNQDGSLNEHSSHYVRINAMANHPAFREAFQCSDNSRMVKSATEQCVIYGKDAPQNKRH